MVRSLYSIVGCALLVEQRRGLAFASMPTLKPLTVAGHLPIGDFIRDWYIIRIRCTCGHEREPRGEFIRRVIGPQTTISELQRRLRCHKCGRRTARVEVYQLPKHA